eukprot:COSAG01_NODE_6796_length_3494_cov_152.073638_6_plen_375_part_00
MCAYSEIAGDLDSRLLQKDEATEFCFLHEVSIIGSTSTSVPPFSMQVRNDMPETVLLATVSDMLSKQWNVTMSPADSSSPHQIFDTVSIVPGTDSMAPDTIFLYVNMSILNVANHYQSQAASGEDPWLWLHTSSPPCSNLYDQRFQLALDKAVLLHRTDLLRQYTSWKSQSMTAQSSTASAPENSQLNTTLASLNVAVSTMSSIFTTHLREYHAHAVLGTIAAEEGWRVEGAVLHACASTSPGGGRTSATLRIGAAHPCPKPQACCCSTAPSHRPPLEPCPHGPPHCCAWRSARMDGTAWRVGTGGGALQVRPPNGRGRGEQTSPPHGGGERRFRATGACRLQVRQAECFFKERSELVGRSDHSHKDLLLYYSS